MTKEDELELDRLIEKSKHQARIADETAREIVEMLANRHFTIDGVDHVLDRVRELSRRSAVQYKPLKWEVNLPEESDRARFSDIRFRPWGSRSSPETALSSTEAAWPFLR